MGKIYHKEEQRYTQWWLWLLILLVFAVSTLPLWYIFIEDVAQRRSQGVSVSYSSELLLTSVITTGIMLFFVLMFKFIKLETEINSEAIRFRYAPFVNKWKLIKASTIESWSVEKFVPSKFGGYGIKIKFRRQKSYTVYGRLCLKLVLKGGQIVMIGTQQKSSIEYAIKKMMQNNQ
ncbi:MAG: hypothetical protein FWG22_00030 [Prolixibacteraceae bacterium]|nr:hypothetical protein [Prolixibacteraceae bacterium]